MELKEFVQQTLIEIIEGVQEAGGGAFKGHSRIAPTLNRPYHFGASPAVLNEIEFDVAVSVDDKATATGGGQVKVLQVVSAGAEKSTELKTTTVTRVKFSVPVYFGASE